jgi:hypothetical protein
VDLRNDMNFNIIPIEILNIITYYDGTYIHS